MNYSASASGIRTGAWCATTPGHAALRCPAMAGGDCTGPTLPTSTRSVVTWAFRCAPISAWIRLATVLLAGLTWIPGASRAPRGLHLPETDRWLALACAAGGTTRWAAGRGQSHATAVMTAVAARAAIGLPAAVHHLHTVLTIADVPAGRGIELATAG